VKALPDIDVASHWNRIWGRKADEDTSWFETEPTLSIEMVGEAAGSDHSLGVLDVGAGTGRLVDRLLDRGFSHLGVLDISQVALARTSERLGDRSDLVEFVNADITEIDEVRGFEIWHDRALFHFLVEEDQISHYVQTLTHSIPTGGHAVIATFAPDGPATCSDLPVHRYSEGELAELLGGFALRRSVRAAHPKPAGGIQRFLYCLFQRRA
jgi:SAM-dependent methyltransferase